MPRRRIRHTSALPVRGDLGLTVRNLRTGRSTRIEKKNVITYLGLGSLIQLWAQQQGTNVADFQVAALCVSTGAVPPTAADTDLAITQGAIVLPLQDANRILTLANPVFELKIVQTLAQNQGNGLTLQEACLKMGNGNGQMLCRQIHPPVAKNAGFEIDYDWRLSILPA